MFVRRNDGPESEPIGGGVELYRRPARSSVMAVGTLACPACDLPVAIDGTLAPADALACAFCGHAGALRDFLSLKAPTRPMRVQVRVVMRRAARPDRAPR